MKILILAYSGSGKSTLAARLSEKYSLPLLYLDKVQFKENWVERSKSEKLSMVEEFLNSNDSWIMDANYTGLHFERRLTEADLIIILDVDRFTCFLRAYKRFLKYRNSDLARPSMSDGCNEKFDFEFIKCLLWQGRSKNKRNLLKFVEREFKEKVIKVGREARSEDIIEMIEKKYR